MGNKTMKSLREKLAELEHDQWIAWSKNIAETENITPARRQRWEKLWIPYNMLTEAQKDQDREWADKVLASILETINSLYREPREYPGDDAVPSDQRTFGGNARLDELAHLLK